MRGRCGWKMSELRNGQPKVVIAPLYGAGGKAAGVPGAPEQGAGEGLGG